MPAATTGKVSKLSKRRPQDTCNNFLDFTFHEEVPGWDRPVNNMSQAHAGNFGFSYCTVPGKWPQSIEFTIPWSLKELCSGEEPSME